MLDVERYLGPLQPPRYCDEATVIAESLPALRPPRRIDVPTWAQGFRKLRTPTYVGSWQNEAVPYLIEPARMMTSRKYNAVIMVMPARTGKTDALVLNAFGHRVCAMPRDMLIVAPTRDTAREFSLTKLAPMIRTTPAVAERQRRGRGADNIFDKLFDGGMRLRMAWPVAGQLSMVDIPDVILTDYDRMPDDVDEEGTPFDLGRKRTQTYGSLGITCAESSPGRPVHVDDWEPTTPHEAPPCDGILGIYNSGTRGQFYWTCPQCATRFRPTFDRLRWEKGDSNGETAKTAAMICPQGCVIGHDRKTALNRSGVWLHETAGGDLVEIGEAAIRDTDIVSYWAEGPIAAFQSWEQLVLRFLDATDNYRSTGDETRLKSTITLDQGRPFFERKVSLGDGISQDLLQSLAIDYPLGRAPRQTRFLTIAVDVQPNRFVVQVDAWGVDLERWLIDRFDVAVPPADSPGAFGDSGTVLRAIDPPRYKEDWRALDELLNRSWPVAEIDLQIKARAMIVDMHGADGTTANAYAFYRRMKRERLQHRVFLQRGRGGVDRERAVFRQLEKIEGPKRRRRSDIFAIETGTDPLKDEIAVSLTRPDGGPNAYHLPAGLGDEVFAEFCAEVRTPKGWREKRGGIRNEALDLAVYGRALAIVLKAEKIDWSAPQPWASAVESNSYAVKPSPAAAADQPPPRSPPAPVNDKRNAGWIPPRRGGWLDR